MKDQGPFSPSANMTEKMPLQITYTLQLKVYYYFNLLRLEFLGLTEFDFKFRLQSLTVEKKQVFFYSILP